MKCATPGCKSPVDSLHPAVGLCVCCSHAYLAGLAAGRHDGIVDARMAESTRKRLDAAIAIVDAAEKWEQTRGDSPEMVQRMFSLSNAIYRHAAAARGEAKGDAPSLTDAEPGPHSSVARASGIVDAVLEAEGTGPTHEKGDCNACMLPCHADYPGHEGQPGPVGPPTPTPIGAVMPDLIRDLGKAVVEYEKGMQEEDEGEPGQAGKPEAPKCADCGTTDVPRTRDLIGLVQPAVDPWLCEPCRKKRDHIARLKAEVKVGDVVRVCESDYLMVVDNVSNDGVRCQWKGRVEGPYPFTSIMEAFRCHWPARREEKKP